MIEIKIYRGLNTSQKKIKAIREIMMNAKPSPTNETNHHFFGSRYGARQAIKNAMATTIFSTRKMIFVKRLYLVDIDKKSYKLQAASCKLYNFYLKVKKINNALFQRSHLP